MEEFSFSFRLLLLPVLLGINSFFAAAEVALVSVRQTRMRQLAEAGDERAKAVLDLRENSDRLLSAVQLGVTLASLGLGWAGEDTVYRLITLVLPQPGFAHAAEAMHLLAFAIAFGIITFLHMVVGEVVPKNLALERTERLALAVAPALEWFARATHFFVRVVENAATLLSRALGLRGAPAVSSHSGDELKLIVTASRRGGDLGAAQEDLLHNVIDFQDLTVRQVMVPRNEMVSLPVEAGLERVVRLLVEHGYSRVPVYEGSPEHIIGILYAKDLWPLWQEQQRSLLAGRPLRPFRLAAMIHPHRVVPETKPLHQMLAEFQQQRYHMAMVVDEFGTIVGLLTVEDVLEQIVGEIRDEHDLPEPAREASEAAVMELDGITNVRDLANLYGIELPYDAGFETLAGFLLHKLGTIPQGGEEVEHEGCRFKVLEMAGHRIARVRIERTAIQSESHV
jgi:CBS domain containing-hemolysin-like protein